MTDDEQLLRQYTEERSESAFGELVTRHIDLVYSAALRVVNGDAHLAQDVTQTVFIDLARKARSLPGGVVLAGWLHRHSSYTAATAVRTERRRRTREQTAMEMRALDDHTEAPWKRIAPYLDEGLNELNSSDRHALVLRFLKRQDFRAVGAAFGISEDSAQKRVRRALEKLRGVLSRRGVTFTAISLSSLLAAEAVTAAPAGLAVGVTGASLGAAAGSGTTLTLLKLMAWTKAKTVIAVSVGMLLAAGTVTITVKEIQMHRTYPWQDMVDGGEQALKALDTTAPQVTIVRSKFGAGRRHDRLIDDIGSPERWRFIGTHATPWENVRDAMPRNPKVNVDLPFYVVLPADMPGGYFDFIANLTNGSQSALLALVRTKFGLIGKYEMREMDVLLLEVDHPNAPGLKPRTTLPPGHTPELTRVSQGIAFYKNRPLFHLARRLEVDLGMPVIDQTGLTGNYDLDVPESLGATPAERLEEARRWLLDDFGLRLVPARQPHEVLIIEKTK